MRGAATARIDDVVYIVAPAESGPTCHVHLSWPRTAKHRVSREWMEALVAPLGAVRCALAANRRSGGASFASATGAAAARVQLDEQVESFLGRKLYAQFAERVDAAEKAVRDARISCTSLTASVVVPGLQILLDFVSAEEEVELLRCVESGSWDDGGPRKMRRRVQHYGYAFDYRTIEIDRTPRNALPPPLDALRVRVRDALGFDPTQLTVNEYEPGQGIKPHVDSPRSFGAHVVSLGLCAPTVFTMRRQAAAAAAVAADRDRGPNGAGAGAGALPHKLVVHPRRALLVMTGDARSRWSHGIAARKADVVDGALVRRRKRVSLTLRALAPVAAGDGV
jgi:alkylated DNA repair protein alkB family protein 8